MEQDKFQRVEELFHRARVLEPPDRASFLDETCDGDLELRGEVESLLAHCDNRTERIEISPSGEGFRAVMVDRDSSGAPLVERGPLTEKAGTRIGNYKILQQIGEGGFGAVYMAEQEEPVRRKVALKIIKLGMDTKQVIARFEAERQALAMMDHPNIAKVLEAGATETGRPYFIMELVKGIPLTEYCDKQKLSTRERLDLFLQVCGAVQHAHQKGVIHRDLKPTNILVTLHDSRPVPKVIDFGIAKATGHRLTEKTLFTEFRQFIGTPEYMSPDQAEISGLDVDTRTDIYSLGVLLYELLTGTTPFDPKTLRQAAYGEIQRIIREVDPPRPSTRVDTLATEGGDEQISKHRRAEPGSLSKLMRGDLDWIVMKAMEKDRTRRYQSASELASDIVRHLNSEPVMAGPPSVFYKFRKFVNRHRVGVSAGTFVAAALIVGLTLATIGLVQATQEARQAEIARAEARMEAERSQRIADLLQDLFISTNPEVAVSQDADVEGVMAAAREVFGDDHATVAATLCSRAVQLQSSGDLVAAEGLYRESLRIWRDLYGNDNINVGTTLSRLGMLLMTKGDDLAAEEALRESLQIIQALPGNETLAACETLAYLAQVLTNRGDFDEAESLLREALRIRQTVAPHQRLQIALTYHALANILAMAGKADEMRALVPEHIEAWRQALPPPNLLVARLLTEYAFMYLDEGDLDTAESLLLEAAETFRQDGDLAARHRTMALRGLWRILESRKIPYDQYLPSRLEFIAYARQVAGTDRQTMGVILNDITMAFRKLGFTKEAIPLCREVVEAARSIGDAGLFDNAVRNLGNLAWDIARMPGQTKADYLFALATIEQALADRVGDPAFTNTVGVLQYRLGRYAEALITLARSDAWYSEQYEGGVPADVAFIAMAHYQLGNEAEALAALERLRTLMLQPDIGKIDENRSFLAEVEALIGDSPPPAESQR
ncbi:MAG: serine/threonine protein kinase [Phycisphaerales bacterium]|nr:MAG: serine/threonine protein kinase [Phycisphaerales bacterium]